MHFLKSLVKRAAQIAMLETVMFFPSAILNYMEVFKAIETIFIIHDHVKKLFVSMTEALCV